MARAAPLDGRSVAGYPKIRGMAKLTDDELALIAQALRSFAALMRGDAERMAPTMAGPVHKRSEAAQQLAERIEKARSALTRSGK
jgi:hypothetical protein